MFTVPFNDMGNLEFRLNQRLHFRLLSITMAEVLENKAVEFNRVKRSPLSAVIGGF